MTYIWAEASYTFLTHYNSTTLLILSLALTKNKISVNIHGFVQRAFEIISSLNFTTAL